MESAPEGLTKVSLKLCNGSDANESALKRARRYTGKSHVISFRGSHLGESSETLSASGYSEERPYLGGSGKYILVDPPKSRPAGDDSPYDGKGFEGFERLVVRSRDVAGIIVEPIMVDAGVIVFPREDLEQMRSLCTEYDIPLIFDEIQTAGGWLGALLASTKLGVTPDIATLGKGLSGGYPLAAVLMHENYDVLDYGEDGYTYGGHLLPCATALATLDVLLETDLLEQVPKKATRIEGHLARLKHKHRAVADYRGEGLLWGIEIEEHESGSNGHTRRVFEKLLTEGVISRIAGGGKGNVLIVKPPLVISEGEIDRAFEAIDDALTSVDGATVVQKGPHSRTVLHTKRSSANNVGARFKYSQAIALRAEIRPELEQEYGIRMTQAVPAAGELNFNWMASGAGVPQRYVVSIPRQNDQIVAGLGKEYAGVGFFRLGGRFRLRTIPEVVWLTNSCHQCGVPAPPIVAWGSSYVVREYIPGTVYEDFLRGGEHPARVAETYLDSLIKAHCHRIVLGDRWGPNEVVRTDRTISFFDFEIALASYGHEMELAQALFHTVTNAGERNQIGLIAQEVCQRRPGTPYDWSTVGTLLEKHLAHFNPAFRAAAAAAAVEDVIRILPSGS